MIDDKRTLGEIIIDGILRHAYPDATEAQLQRAAEAMKPLVLHGLEAPKLGRFAHARAQRRAVRVLREEFGQDNSTAKEVMDDYRARSNRPAQQ